MASLRTALGITLITAAAGCADQGGQTLIILNNAVPQAGCLIDPAGSGDPILGIGQVDAIGVLGDGTSIGYLLTPTIMNIADSQNGTFSIERTVITTGARVEVVPGAGPDGMPILSAAELTALGEVNTRFTSLFTVDIAPDGGLVGAAFDVLPAPVLEAIGTKLSGTQLAQVRVDVSVFGETIAGTDVESDPFRYPITICNGCQQVNLGSCVGLAPENIRSGGACNAFQDAAMDCCTSSMGAFLCPAVPEDPPMP
jgi:hypothetical protein